MSCCKEAKILRTAVIKKCRKEDYDPKRPASEQRVCLYSKKIPGKLLGRHPNEESAKKQEAAIQIHKHGNVLKATSKKLRVIAQSIKNLLEKK